MPNHRWTFAFRRPPRPSRCLSADRGWRRARLGHKAHVSRPMWRLTACTSSPPSHLRPHSRSTAEAIQKEPPVIVVQLQFIINPINPKGLCSRFPSTRVFNSRDRRWWVRWMAIGTGSCGFALWAAAIRCAGCVASSGIAAISAAPPWWRRRRRFAGRRGEPTPVFVRAVWFQSTSGRGGRGGAPVRGAARRTRSPLQGGTPAPGTRGIPPTGQTESKPMHDF